MTSHLLSPALPSKISDTDLGTTSPHCNNIQHLCTEDSSLSSVAKRTANVFHRVRIAKSLLRSWTPARTETRTEPKGKNPDSVTDRSISIPGANKRIVVYFTSLRVVRSIFEDCKTVRSILRGFRVLVDERDLSMDSGFLNELQGILGQRKLALPRVFIDGRYMGGAEEIKQLHETGELKKFVESCPQLNPAPVTFAAFTGSSYATNVTVAVNCTLKNLGSRLVPPVTKMA